MEKLVLNSSIKQEVRKDLETAETDPILKESKEVLDSIDWTTLKGIYDEELKRARVQARAEDLIVGKDGITIDAQEAPDTPLHNELSLSFGAQASPGGFEPIGRKITLVPKLIEQQFVKDTASADLTPSTFERAFISNLIHEETHAISGVVSLDEGRENLGAGYQVFDHQISKDSEDIERGFGSGINEAVTDLIAEEVYKKYKQRTGSSSESGSYVPAYHSERTVTAAFVTHVAAIAEVPYEQVWGALKQGYFQGVNLKNNELGELYGEVLKDISDVEASGQRPGEVFTLLSKMELRNPPQELRERIMRGVMKLEADISRDEFKSINNEVRAYMDERPLPERIQQVKDDAKKDREQAQKIIDRLRAKNSRTAIKVAVKKQAENIPNRTGPILESGSLFSRLKERTSRLFRKK
jgi:hypothetical protein